MTYKKIIISVLTGLLVIFLIIQLVVNSKPRFDGRITLSRKTKAPYGTYVAHEMIKEEFPGAQLRINRKALTEWSTEEFDSSGQALLIIDNYFDPTERDLDLLTAFAQKGNIVFISAVEMNETAQKFFHVSQPSRYVSKSLERSKVLFPDQPFGVHLDTTTFGANELYYYPGAAYGNEFTTSNPTFTYSLGYTIDSALNLVAIDSHSGSLYLHASPAVFTNFFLLYRDNYTHFKQLMDLIPSETKLIYWDEYFIRNKTSPSEDNAKGIMAVFLAYPSFKWAFWTVLLLVGIFLITEIQRRQRWVPQKNKPVNESLDFVETIGNLYFEKADNRMMAGKLTALFMEQIRSRFAINTNHLDQAFVQKLSLKSGAPLTEVQVLVDKIKALYLMDSVDDATLKEYYFLLDQFIKKI